MAKVTKIADKLSKVNDNFTVNMYDNGFMLEIGGRDADDDWANAKIMCSSDEELLTLVKEAASLPRSE